MTRLLAFATSILTAVPALADVPDRRHVAAETRPRVGSGDACRTLAQRTYVLGGGERLAEPVGLRQVPLLRASGPVKTWAG